MKTKGERKGNTKPSLRRGSTKPSSRQFAWDRLSFNDESPRETAWLVTLLLDAESCPSCSMTRSCFLVFCHHNCHWNHHIQSYHLTTANGVAGCPSSLSAQSSPSPAGNSALVLPQRAFLPGSYSRRLAPPWTPSMDMEPRPGRAIRPRGHTIGLEMVMWPKPGQGDVC